MKQKYNNIASKLLVDWQEKNKMATFVWLSAHKHGRTLGYFDCSVTKNGINAAAVLVVECFGSVVLQYNEVDRKQY